jgi:hypothetical protein
MIKILIVLKDTKRRGRFKSSLEFFDVFKISKKKLLKPSLESGKMK